MPVDFNLGARADEPVEEIQVLGRRFVPHGEIIPPYNHKITHGVVTLGFTHSFPKEAADQPEGVPRPPLPNFVCTGCGDVLYLAAPDNKRRVYALQCGHLFDGACIERLCTPPPGVFPQTENIPDLAVGPGIVGGGTTGDKGKRKLVEEEVPTWAFVCPECERPHQSEWDASAGVAGRGAWVSRGPEGAIMLYL
ncbi:hypothetical protein CALCODRAFT_487896 [Calocera cornea HHB12733]|uniref:Uncharacterized protein n=1 Tax=Calocera cornea HHB12733 TaxID=1353952 RepID=A0A165CVD9_9BASI|nr:hypothetical protein CALCODRAFT_487896 [Calocera cornea HHB12733]